MHFNNIYINNIKTKLKYQTSQNISLLSLKEKLKGLSLRIYETNNTRKIQSLYGLTFERKYILILYCNLI